ncbi:RNA-binding domain-containing protein [Herpetosiphon sp. NSE202]|uniref:RNA-binding domain-containing protein n=1 Tax=Herpetosiphon sp. NSE202 TaxID=3351349 RepID=UPI003633FFB2
MTFSDEQLSAPSERWMRLDLHIHTPASEDYAEPEVSYLDILRAAAAHQLDIIAFTDHNTIRGYEQFRDELALLERFVQADRCTPEERERYGEYQQLLAQLTVLPGFEFTSHYGSHILALFAPTTPLSVLEAVLLQLGIPAQELKAGSCSISNTKHVTEAYEIINRAGGIVIAAHVNAHSGVVSESIRFGNSGQSRVAATQSPYLHALEFVHFYASHESYLSPTFYNGQHTYYERPMFCIQGSDAHRINRAAADDQESKKLYGVGDRYFEALLSEASFDALKTLLNSKQIDKVRVPRRDQKQWEIDNVRLNGDSRHLIARPATEEYLAQVWHDVAALANADGGVILIGTDGEQTVSASSISEQIKQLVAQNLDPQPNLSLELMQYQERDVVRVEVKPDELPPYVASNGAVYVRRDDQTQVANREELLQLARRALVRSMMSPLDNGEDLELPRSGVEIVSEQKRNSVWTYEVRDLRTTTGVERDRAQGLWAYAISRHEELRDAKIDLNEDVRWYGRLGVWRTFQQGNRTKYDLIHRDASGVIDHIFYGVSEWGLGEGWRALLGINDSFAVDANDNDDHAPISAPRSFSPPIDDAEADNEDNWLPWGDRKYRWKGRGGLWRIYGNDEKMRFDLAMKNKEDEDFQTFNDVTRAKLTEAWLNLIRVKPPTTGIEVVAMEESDFGRSFRFRNLRSGEVSDPWRDLDLEQGTVREYAARMFLEDLPIDEASVRWWGNIGYMRPMRSQVDLVYRDEDGVDHIYYAARREELENEWRELLELWDDE